MQPTLPNFFAAAQADRVTASIAQGSSLRSTTARRGTQCRGFATVVGFSRGLILRAFRAQLVPYARCGKDVPTQLILACSVFTLPGKALRLELQHVPGYSLTSAPVWGSEVRLTLELPASIAGNEFPVTRPILARWENSCAKFYTPQASRLTNQPLDAGDAVISIRSPRILRAIRAVGDLDNLLYKVSQPD